MKPETSMPQLWQQLHVKSASMARIAALAEARKTGRDLHHLAAHHASWTLPGHA